MTGCCFEWVFGSCWGVLRCVFKLSGVWVRVVYAGSGYFSLLVVIFGSLGWVSRVHIWGAGTGVGELAQLSIGVTLTGGSPISR